MEEKLHEIAAWSVEAEQQSGVRACQLVSDLHVSAERIAYYFAQYQQCEPESAQAQQLLDASGYQIERYTLLFMGLVTIVCEYFCAERFEDIVQAFRGEFSLTESESAFAMFLQEHRVMLYEAYGERLLQERLTEALREHMDGMWGIVTLLGEALQKKGWLRCLFGRKVHEFLHMGRTKIIFNGISAGAASCVRRG